MQMRTQKLQCPQCGTSNWSGAEYCRKCSGALYRERDAAQELFRPRNWFVYLN